MTTRRRPEDMTTDPAVLRLIRFSEKCGSVEALADTLEGNGEDEQVTDALRRKAERDWEEAMR